MARARNIKPAFFTNEDLAELPPLTRLAFIGLWTIADFKGCLAWRPKRIKVQVLPYDDVDMEDVINDLAAGGFVLRYEVAGEGFVKIKNFIRHQNPHKQERDAGSNVPDYPDAEHASPQRVEALRNNFGTASEANVLIPDSLNLNPDSLNLNPERGDAAAAASPQKRGSRLPADFALTDEMLEWSRTKCPEVDADLETEKFCNYWRAATGSNATKLDWQLTWKNWILNAKGYGKTFNNTFSNGRRTDEQVFAESAEFYRNYSDAGSDEPGAAD